MRVSKEDDSLLFISRVHNYHTKSAPRLPINPNVVLPILVIDSDIVDWCLWLMFCVSENYSTKDSEDMLRTSEIYDYFTTANLVLFLNNLWKIFFFAE